MLGPGAKIEALQENPNIKPEKRTAGCFGSARAWVRDERENSGIPASLNRRLVEKRQKTLPYEGHRSPTTESQATLWRLDRAHGSSNPYSNIKPRGSEISFQCLIQGCIVIRCLARFFKFFPSVLSRGAPWQNTPKGFFDAK